MLTERKTYAVEELEEIQRLHLRWWRNQSGGSRAVLTDAVLTDAVLRGAVGAPVVPVVPDLDARMAAAVGDGGEHLDMAQWHDSCGTSHCRAGWAVTLAGPEGKALEERVGSATAGALTYTKSTGHAPPDFYCGNDEALRDIKACATRQPKAVQP